MRLIVRALSGVDARLQCRHKPVLDVLAYHDPAPDFASGGRRVPPEVTNDKQYAGDAKDESFKKGLMITQRLVWKSSPKRSRIALMPARRVLAFGEPSNSTGVIHKRRQLILS